MKPKGLKMVETSSQANALEPLLTLNQLAAYLSVPKSWVYAQTRTARKTGFPVIKAGKYCRFNRHRVMAWLEEQGE